MNMYCICTNHTPDFVPALWLAYDVVLDNMLNSGVWLCHDCFEHHVVHNYNIRTVPETTWLVEIELLADEVEQ